MPFLDCDRFEARLREVTRRGLLGDALARAAAPSGPPDVGAGSRMRRAGSPNAFGSLTIGDHALATPREVFGRSDVDDTTEGFNEHHGI